MDSVERVDIAGSTKETFDEDDREHSANVRNEGMERLH